MNKQILNRRRPRVVLNLESLEGRALMATFHVPTLAGLDGGRNIAKTFERLVGSLQAQIAIEAPKDDDPAHLTQVVNELVDQYESASASLFGSRPALVALLNYQGETTRDAINAAKLQLDAGLITRGTFNSTAFSEIQQITLSRQVWPVGTPLQTYLVLSTQTSDGLSALSQAVGASTSTITNQAAAALVGAEAEAYQSEVLLATTRQPRIANMVSSVTASLTSQVAAAVGDSNFAAQLGAAAAGFTSALVAPGGFFGPGGTIGRLYAQLPTVSNPLTISQAATFAHLQYRQAATTSPFVLHRNFSSSVNQKGGFLSSDTFKSPADAVRRLALDQSWYGTTNQASFVEDVTLPANTTYYVGRVAPIYQGIFQREAKPSLYPGMASQYLVLSRDPNIKWDNFRATGT